MKITLSILIIIAAAGAKILAGDSPDATGPAESNFKPTLKQDEHDQPVFTSPTNGLPAVSARAQTNDMPAIPSWPVTNMPPMTNWPKTNLPVMTNPPPSQIPPVK